MRSSKILLIVTGLDNPFLRSVDWDAMEKPLGAITHVICEEEDCMKTLLSSASAVLYLDGFPVSYDDVVQAASVRWNAPPVFHVSEDCGMVRIDWNDGSHEVADTNLIPSVIESSVMEEKREYQANNLAFILFAILAITLLVGLHITCRSVAQALPVVEANE